MNVESTGIAIRIKIAGPAFQSDRAVLEPTLTMLIGYEQALAHCLQEAAVSNGFSKDLLFRSNIKLRKIESGCLEIHTLMDFAAGLLPFGTPTLGLAVSLTPEVLRQGWELLVAAYKVVSTAVKYFREQGKPIVINIDNSNSPGANVQVIIGKDGNISHMVASPQVVQVAKDIYGSLEQIAKPVAKGEADSLSIDAGYGGAESYIVNKSNKDNFKYVTQEKIDENVLQIKAHMYRLNTKRKTGTLEIVDDQDRGPIPFTIESGNMEEYVDSLKAKESTFFVKREMSVNALGEIKVNRLFLVGIEPEK